MNYVRPKNIPAFVDSLEEQGVDTEALKDALDSYLRRVEFLAQQIDPFQDPEGYLDAENYLEKIRDLQTVFIFEGFND